MTGDPRSDDGRSFVHLASGDVLPAEALYHRFVRNAWTLHATTGDGIHYVETEDGELRCYLPEERFAVSIDVE